MSQWYDVKNYGGMYVHTNYESFKSNFGSFGEHTGELVWQAQHFLQEQLEREELLNVELADLFNIIDEDIQVTDGFEAFLDWFSTGPDAYFNRVAKQTYETEIEPGMLPVVKFGKWSEAEHVQTVEESVNLLENMYISIVNAIEQVSETGTLSYESFVKAKSRIESELRNYSAKEDTNTIRGHVRSIKGLLYELYVYRFIFAALKATAQKNENLDIILQGSGNVADIAVNLTSISLGVNIKSASLKTFAGNFGVTLFSGTIGSIVEKMKSTYGLQALDLFKYYLINLSRMRAAPLTGQGGNPNIRHSAEGFQLVKDVLMTYATVFIGSDSHQPEDIDQNLKQADVLILAERIYKKSEILIELLQTGDIESFLMISYGATHDWDSFDRLKRQKMRAAKGDYGAVVGSPFLQSPYSALANQPATVRLRLLNA